MREIYFLIIGLIIGVAFSIAVVKGDIHKILETQYCPKCGYNIAENR